MLRLADITRTTPFQTRLGVGPGQTATTQRQSLWLPRAPWELEMPFPWAISFEAPLLGFSQDILEGILPLLETNRESLDVTFDQKNPRHRDPDQAEEEPSSYIHLLFEK